MKKITDKDVEALKAGKKVTKGKVLFLGENVRMRDEHRWVITEELGVEPVEIDSALVSAQTKASSLLVQLVGRNAERQTYIVG
jgi:hypothetical protein